MTYLNALRLLRADSNLDCEVDCLVWSGAVQAEPALFQQV